MERAMTTRVWLAPLILTLAAAAFTLPMLWNGFLPSSWNGRLHESWYGHFSQQFWAGEAYPRWLSGMNEGLGSPVFFYYPPLPYWITCLLSPCVPNDPVGWRQLGFSSFVALLISGLGCYAWTKELTARVPATIAGILFMLMPYHLQTDLYVRGAFAEFWAFAWLPWILFYIERMAKPGWFAVPGLAFSYGALIMTHLPTTLIFSLVPIFYALMLAWRAAAAKIFVRTIMGMTLGIGLASIYLIPAMTMQEHASMEELTSLSYYYKGFFFTESNLPVWSLGSDFKTKLFWLVMATVGCAICAACLAKKTEDASLRLRLFFWAGTSLFALFMMFPVSDPLWRLFPVIQIIQFPWRFNTVLCLATTPLIALAIDGLKRPLVRGQVAFLQISHALIISWLYVTVLAIWSLHLAPQESAPTLGTTDAPEYRPRAVKTSRRLVIDQYGLREPDRERGRLTEASGTVRTVMARPRYLSISVSASADATLLVRHFYFAGWIARLDGGKVELRPTDPEGLMSVRVPAGNHIVELSLPPLLPERVGAATSAFSLLSLLLFIGIKSKPRTSSGGSAPAPR
jgi:uncharacterized membrane protein